MRYSLKPSFYCVKDTTEATCPAGWTELDGQCYKLEMYNDGLQVIIESAQALCETIGGHLGLVPNQAVADLVSQLANTMPDANVIIYSITTM